MHRTLRLWGLVPSSLTWTGQPSRNWNATTQDWPAPVFKFHRLWAETDVATAYAVYRLLFPND